MRRTTIIGSGHYLPPVVVKNEDFLNHVFYDESGAPMGRDNEEVIEKFQSITEIAERRYVEDNMLSSDIASMAAKKAIEDAAIDPETLDYIIVAHNFGDLSKAYSETDIMPSLAAKVKHNLGIKNRKCKPYDMIFGCPGWIEGFILGHQFIQAGLAEHILVVGTETLSRVTDPHDRNAMIFADGAGAVVISSTKSEKEIGVIEHGTVSDMGDELHYLINAPSFNPAYTGSKLNIHMNGRKIYEYALKNVPSLVKEVLDDAGVHLSKINKVLIHQANAKMDYAILDRLCKLYGMDNCHEDLAPMTIQSYGNSSVATIPTLYDKLVRNELEGHQAASGDYIVFASVGAGMNINAMLYKMP